MKCALGRHGETRSGFATVTLQRGETTVAIKGVPADIFDHCGEYYLNAEMSARILGLAEEAVRHGTEVEVLRYAARGDDD